MAKKCQHDLGWYLTQRKCLHCGYKPLWVTCVPCGKDRFPSGLPVTSFSTINAIQHIIKFKDWLEEEDREEGAAILRHEYFCPRELKTYKKEAGHSQEGNLPASSICTRPSAC